MRRSRRACLRSTLGLVVLAALQAGEGRAEDEAPLFRITNVEGNFKIGGWTDRLDARVTPAGSTQESTTRATQSDLRTSLFVNTRSYVIHPNFLNLEVGAGPILDRATSGTGEADYSATRALYDLSARAEILRGKPYWGHLFYDHLNPTVSVAAGDVLLTQSTRYGFDFALQEGMLPVGFDLDAFNSHNEGRSAERRQDDRIEQIGIRAFRQYSPSSHSRFALRASRQTSSSGSAFLPILESRSTSYDLSLDNQSRFGAANRWTLLNPNSFGDQAYRLNSGREIKTRTWRSTLDLRGEHSEDNTLKSRLSADFAGTQQDASRLSSQLLGAGVVYLPHPSLSTTLDLRGDHRESTEVKGTGMRLDGTARYSVDLPLGTGVIGYSARASQQDQDASSSVAPVRGESITLTGLNPVGLARRRVAAGSVVVSNATRSQVYVEGMDYQLTVVGLETRVARLPAGLIASGESVLVDYSYDVGGTYKYRQIDNGIDVGWSPNSRTRMSVRYLDSRQSLLSGAPTTPLNNVKDVSATLQADVPFIFLVDMTAGGLLEWERRREDILPFRRQQAQAYYQTQFPVITWAGMRISGRRSKTDYVDPLVVDSDITAWDASVWARPWYGIDLFLAFNGERDTGPAILRRNESASARATWRYRQLSLSLSYVSTRETQGTFSRNRSHGEFLLRRDF